MAICQVCYYNQGIVDCESTIPNLIIAMHIMCCRHVRERKSVSNVSLTSTSIDDDMNFSLTASSTFTDIFMQVSVISVHNNTSCTQFHVAH